MVPPLPSPAQVSGISHTSGEGLAVLQASETTLFRAVNGHQGGRKQPPFPSLPILIGREGKYRSFGAGRKAPGEGPGARSTKYLYNIDIINNIESKDFNKIAIT